MVDFPAFDLLWRFELNFYFFDANVFFIFSCLNFWNHFSMNVNIFWKILREKVFDVVTAI